MHETLEGLMANNDFPIPPLVRPVAEAFQKFAAQHEIIPLQIESQIVSHKHGYAGTIDVLAEVDGVVGVLDIKTSKAIYRDYGIQTAAYVAALHEDPLIPPLMRWILRADQSRPCVNGCGSSMRDKGGTSTMKESRYGIGCAHAWGPMTGEIELKELGSFEKDMTAFLAAKTLWEWEHDYWLSKIIN